MFSEEQLGSSETAGTVPESQSATAKRDSASAGPSVSGGLMASGDASEPPQATPPVIEASDESAVGSSVSEAAEIRNRFESMDRLSPIAAGEVVSCTVLKVTDTEVIVDIGLKSEPALPRTEFSSAEGTVSVKPGDRVDILIESYDEEEGTVTASYQRAARIRAWEEIDRAFNDQTNIAGRVLARTKGGLEVDVSGIRAFLPASQADMRPRRNLDCHVGEEITCKVAKLDRKRSNVVVSRKVVMEEEFHRRRSQLLDRLSEGAILVGRVKNLVDYGAFVDLGGMDGLLHITDLSWGRVSHPPEVVQVGQEDRVKVLKYMPEKERVSLGLKQTLPDRWTALSERLSVGAVVEGRVRNLTDFGAFVEIEEGVDGLIHLSDLSWTKKVKHPSEVLKKGQRVEAVILALDPEHRRLSLGLKQLQPDAWETFFEKTRVGDTLRGRVVRVAAFGAFVELEEGIEGLCHISEMGDDHGAGGPHPVDVGRELRFRVIRLSPGEKRIGLSLNNVEQDAVPEEVAENIADDIEESPPKAEAAATPSATGGAGEPASSAQAAKSGSSA